MKLNSGTHHIPLHAAIEFHRVDLARSRDEAPLIRLQPLFSETSTFGTTRNGSRQYTFGGCKDFWCENVFTARLRTKPFDFRPLIMWFPHVCDL